MTYQTYIETALSKFNLSLLEIGLIVADNKIVATDEADSTIAKTAIHKSLSVWLPVNSSISEGGVAIAWNLEAVKLYYASLCEELGLNNIISESSNTIRDKSNIW